MKKLLILLLPLNLLLAQPQNFPQAKNELIRIYKMLGEDFQKDFYCQTPFIINHKSKTPKLQIIKDDTYTPRNPTTKKGKINNRSKIIEWEHIMPAQNFGKHLQCWKEGGRKACQKDETFNKMESDMQNLVPAIGEINGDRSNYRYAQAPKDLIYNQYGKCQVYTDFKNKRFYPAEYSRGYIARSYLYMSKTYHIKLSDQDQKLMEAWDKLYPMNEQERKIRETIANNKFSTK